MLDNDTFATKGALLVAATLRVLRWHSSSQDTTCSYTVIYRGAQYGQKIFSTYVYLKNEAAAVRRIAGPDDAM